LKAALKRGTKQTVEDYVQRDSHFSSEKNCISGGYGGGNSGTLLEIFQALTARPSDLKSAVNVNSTFKTCSALQERRFTSITKVSQLVLY
jgi:hypothetical protein